MAYFKPVRDYQLHLINKIINKYNVKDPFLEIGCGDGFFLQYLSDMGLKGVGIDKSKFAISKAKQRNIKNVIIKNIDLFNFKEFDSFNFILLIDVVEHIKYDIKALEHIKKLLRPGGILIFQVPSHRRKYSWIDVNYGHFRRYDRLDMIKLVNISGFELVDLWCSGFPFFSIMEDFISVLGKIFKNFFNRFDSMQEKTEISGIKSPISEKIPVTEKFFNINMLWKFLFKVMDIFLNTNLGSTYFTVAKKG